MTACCLQACLFAKLLQTLASAEVMVIIEVADGLLKESFANLNTQKAGHAIETVQLLCLLQLIIQSIPSTAVRIRRI